MNRDNKYLKFAFTMAEAILTLTIIGVVAALMLRSVNRINPDKNKVLFLRSFHALESAVSDIINDTSFYDHDIGILSDFSSDPLPMAVVELNSTQGSVLCSKKSNFPDGYCKHVIDKTNAFCYFVASKLSLDSVVNCSAGDKVMNFRTANGVCFYGLAGRVPPFDFVIEPGCKGIENGYAAFIFTSGGMSVSDVSSTYGDVFDDENRQKLAYRWVNEQTEVKKKDYDFDSSSGEDSTSE